mmetsp:Transcript_25823/g.67684  ORF Transcript_25823/g.67684 Transcript_25823/m.67684 type:complete len:208 (+) Transcript_25823:500-1123(+)
MTSRGSSQKYRPPGTVRPEHVPPDHAVYQWMSVTIQVTSSSWVKVSRIHGCTTLRKLLKPVSIKLRYNFTPRLGREEERNMPAASSSHASVPFSGAQDRPQLKCDGSFMRQTPPIALNSSALRLSSQEIIDCTTISPVCFNEMCLFNVVCSVQNLGAKGQMPLNVPSVLPPGNACMSSVSLRLYPAAFLMNIRSQDRGTVTQPILSV